MPVKAVTLNTFSNEQKLCENEVANVATFNGLLTNAWMIFVRFEQVLQKACLKYSGVYSVVFGRRENVLKSGVRSANDIVVLRSYQIVYAIVCYCLDIDKVRLSSFSTLKDNSISSDQIF